MPTNPPSWGAGGGGSFAAGASYYTPPSAHKYLAWTYDPIQADSGSAAVLGTAMFCRLELPVNMTVTSLVAYVTNGLTGAPTFAGAALYDGSGHQGGAGVGVRFATTADQSAVWNTTGEKVMALTAGGGQSLNLTGGLGVWIYTAFLTAGGTTAAGFSRFNQAARNNVGLAAADGFRFGNLAGQANLPATITLASLADASSQIAWAALK